MALRNAFENVATESKQDDAIIELQSILSELETSFGDTSSIDTVRELLLRIYTAVDGLELSADNLNINLGDVEVLLAELNTDVGEINDLAAPTGDGSTIALLKAIRDKLTELDTSYDTRDHTTDANLTAFKNEAKAEADETQSLISQANADIVAAIEALEVTLYLDNAELNLNVDQVEALLASAVLEVQNLQAQNQLEDDETQAAIAALQSALASALSDLQAQNLTEDNQTQVAVASAEAAIVAAVGALEAQNQLEDDETQAAIAALQSALQSAISNLQAQNLAEDNETQAAVTSANADITSAVNNTIAKLNEVLAELGTQQKNSLTDAELRATSVAVSTGLDGTLDDVKRSITDFETRLDYDVRSDGNPVYVGKATQGTATAAASWTIQKLEYDTSSRLERVQVKAALVWDDRGVSF